MFGKKSPQNIAVEFRDADTDQVLAQSAMPVASLPDSFEADTTLTMGNDHWNVVRAEPMTKKEFGQSGQLRLWLRKVRIEHVDPSELLLSLPTLSNELPALAPGSSKLNRNVLELHEDDWRQIEFVALGQQTAIDKALAEIQRIYREERQGIGFRNLYVRDEIAAPLAGANIKLDDLSVSTTLPVSFYEGIAFQGVAGVVEDGFAFSWANAPCWYGLERDGVVEVWCLDAVSRTPLPHDAARQLAAFAKAKQICLVDWCRALQLMPEDDAFLEYLSREG